MLLSEHETAIVGLALIDPSTIDRCELSLSGHQWRDEASGKLWAVLCRMRRAGMPIGDIRAVAAEARTANVLDAVGGAVGIGKILANAGMPDQDGYHLAQITDADERSRYRTIGVKLADYADDPQYSIDDLQTWLYSQLSRVQQTGPIQARTIGELAREAIELGRQPNNSPGVFSGLIELDELNGGFRAGEMIVLAARPSVGKSAIAAQWALHAAGAGHSALFISLEMKSIDVASRAIAMHSGVSLASIRSGLGDREYQHGLDAVQALDRSPLRIADHRNLSIDRLQMLIRSEAAHHNLGIVYVDYIGLIAPIDRRKPRWEYVTEISNALKSLALAESIPIVALCQLNRDAEGEVPKLSHLRESGAIEQDADMVLLLHRESRQVNEAELHVAKNRNGAVGKILLTYEPTRFRFAARFNDFCQ